MTLPTTVRRTLQRWFYLDDQHADYVSIITSLETITDAHLANFFSNVAGRDAERRMVRVAMTSGQIAAHSPTLVPGAANCVKDQFDYSASNYQFDVLTRSTGTIGGFTFKPYGKLKLAASMLPTTGEDRRIAHYKNETTETILYIAQDAGGVGDGSSYLDPAPIKDILDQTPTDAPINPTSFQIIVLSGRLSRFNNEGGQGGLLDGSVFVLRDGTSGDRSVIMSHPLERVSLMKGVKLGGGSWGEPSSWTDNSDDTWTIDVGAVVRLSASGFVMSDDGGTLRALTKVGSLASCQSAADSFFVEVDWSGNDDRVTVHLAGGNDPKQTTYFGIATSGGVSVSMGISRYFDLYGIDLYGTRLSESWASNYSAIGCSVNFLNSKSINATHGSVSESNGFFVSSSVPTWPDAPQDRKFLGCFFDHCSDGFYDSGGGHDLTAKDTIFKDCFFTDIGKDEFGLNLANTDSHSLATMGHRGLLQYINCGMDNCGWVTIHTAYASSNNAFVPVPYGSTISNGTFTIDLTDWTDESDVNATIAQASGQLQLISTGDTPIAQQVVTVAAEDQTLGHVLELWADADVDIDIGITEGGSEIIDSAVSWLSGGGNRLRAYEAPPSWTDGWDTALVNIRRVSFTPNAATIYVRIKGRNTSGTILVDNVKFKDLADTEGFTLGFPAAERKLYTTTDTNDTFYHNTPSHNSIVRDNWMRNVITNALNATISVSGRGIQLSGDNFVYGAAGTGAIFSHKTFRNILQGPFPEAIVTKYIPESLTKEDIDIYQNVIEGAVTAFRHFGQATGIDDGGAAWDPFVHYHHNLHHDTTLKEIVASNVTNTDNHEHVHDFNNFSFSVAHIAEPWQKASSKYASLAAWQAAAPAGDTLPNTPIIWPEKLPKPNERRTDDGEDSNSKE